MRLKQEFRVRVEALSRLGKLYPVLVAKEEGGTKLLLYKLNVAADTRYRDVELLGCLAEAEILGNLDEALKLLCVHFCKCILPKVCAASQKTADCKASHVLAKSEKHSQSPTRIYPTKNQSIMSGQKAFCSGRFDFDVTVLKISKHGFTNSSTVRIIQCYYFVNAVNKLTNE